MSDLTLSWEERDAPRRDLAKKYPADWPLQFMLQRPIVNGLATDLDFDLALHTTGLSKIVCWANSSKPGFFRLYIARSLAPRSTTCSPRLEIHPGAILSRSSGH